MSKQVKIKFSKDALVVYEYISNRALSSKSERIMLKAILRNLDELKRNPQKGQALAKCLIPEEYLRKYEVLNLYRLELPFFWRMLYSLKSDGDVEIIAIVLDIINHKEYDKKFGYK
ncbi:MAG: hypothetical protein ACP5N2_02675 [Candidatus Nanoarchaeia archaeon]